MSKARATRTPRRKRVQYPHSTQSSDSEPDIDDELDLDLDQGTVQYEPKTPAKWRGSVSSILQGFRSPIDKHKAVYDARSSPVAWLPAEILIYCLKQTTEIRDLHSALLVSRLWCQCAVELLWLKPIILHPDALSKFTRVINDPDPTFAYARFVRRLNFTAVSSLLTDTSFRDLAACERLERLTLNGCVHLTDGALEAVFLNMCNLVALDLTGVIDVTDQSIGTLAASAPKLQGINLEGCKKVTDIGIFAIARHCPLLRRIKLCEIEGITSISISSLVVNCPLLIEIDLNSCTSITDAAVRDIWRYSTHLRELRLAQCLNITDIGFPIPTHLAPPPTNPFSDTQALMARLTVPILPPLLLSRPLIHLRQLDLMHLAITDAAVDGIVSNAPKLRNLVLAKCIGLTDVAVRSIAKLGRHLQFLHLGHASAITDKSVSLLAKSCTRLRYVDLACCPLLTDESVKELACLPKLRRIGLVRVVNLTDRAVEYLTARHNTLERVHLSYCDKITVAAIHHLLQKLTKLTHLSLTGVPAFRRHNLQNYCRSPPANFNDVQRAAFCVYSGTGIQNLRNYLERKGPDRLGDEQITHGLSESEGESGLIESGIEESPEAETILSPPVLSPSPPPLSHAIHRTQASSGYHRQHTLRSALPTTTESSGGSRPRPSSSLAGPLPNPVIGNYLRSRFQKATASRSNNQTRQNSSAPHIWIPSPSTPSTSVSSSAPSTSNVRPGANSHDQRRRDLQPQFRTYQVNNPIVVNGCEIEGRNSRTTRSGSPLNPVPRSSSLPRGYVAENNGETPMVDPNWNSDSSGTSKEPGEGDGGGRRNALSSSVNGECESGPSNKAERPDTTLSTSESVHSTPTPKSKKGFLGTLSAAEHYASTFLFKGKGKSKDTENPAQDN